MNQQPRYLLGAADRLKSRKRIDQLFKEGKAFSHFPFRVLYLFQPRSGENMLQAGFTVSSRHFKKAVDRNRIKRQLREAYRLQKQELQDQLQGTGRSLLLFFVYTGNELPEYKLVTDKTATALKRLLKIVQDAGPESAPPTH